MSRDCTAQLKPDRPHFAVFQLTDSPCSPELHPNNLHPSAGLAPAAQLENQMKAANQKNIRRTRRVEHRTTEDQRIATGLDRGIPPCASAMGCLCAGHARGIPADEPCDTDE